MKRLTLLIAVLGLVSLPVLSGCTSQGGGQPYALTGDQTVTAANRPFHNGEGNPGVAYYDLERAGLR